jgi:hypothetical protein
VETTKKIKCMYCQPRLKSTLYPIDGVAQNGRNLKITPGADHTNYLKTAQKSAFNKPTTWTFTFSIFVNIVEDPKVINLTFKIRQI